VFKILRVNKEFISGAKQKKKTVFQILGKKVFNKHMFITLCSFVVWDCMAGESVECCR